MRGPRPLYMIISIYFTVRNVQAKVEPMLEAALQGLAFAVHVSKCREIQKEYLYICILHFVKIAKFNP